MATTTQHDDLAPAHLHPAQAATDERQKTSPAVGDTLLTVALALYPAWGALGLITAGLLFTHAGA